MRRSSAALAAATLALTLTPLGAADGSPSPRADDPVVVDAGGARVVVERSPFRLTVTDGSGQPVLRQVPHAETDTIVEPVTLDPIGTGADNQDTTTLYSPLSFLVGTEVLAQHVASEWVGNLLSGTRSGTWYAAQDVETVEQDGADLVLTLSTNDPTGRELVVRIGAEGEDAVRVRVAAEPADGVAMIGDSFEASATPGQEDGFFGFGGRHDRPRPAWPRPLELRQPAELQQHPGRVRRARHVPERPRGRLLPAGDVLDHGLRLPAPPARARPVQDGRGPRRRVERHRLGRTPRLHRRTGRPAPLVAHADRADRAPPHTPALGPRADVRPAGEELRETLENYESELRQDIKDIDRYDLPLTAYRLEGSVFPGTPDNHGMELHSWCGPRSRPG